MTEAIAATRNGIKVDVYLETCHAQGDRTPRRYDSTVGRYVSEDGAMERVELELRQKAPKAYEGRGVSLGSVWSKLSAESRIYIDRDIRYELFPAPSASENAAGALTGTQEVAEGRTPAMTTDAPQTHSIVLKGQTLTVVVEANAEGATVVRVVEPTARAGETFASLAAAGTALAGRRVSSVSKFWKIGAEAKPAREPKAKVEKAPKAKVEKPVAPKSPTKAATKAEKPSAETKAAVTRRIAKAGSIAELEAALTDAVELVGAPA